MVSYSIVNSEPTKDSTYGKIAGNNGGSKVWALADFEVIGIVDDINPYPALLGIDWAIDMNGIDKSKEVQDDFREKVTTRSGTFRPCGRITLHRANARLR